MNVSQSSKNGKFGTPEVQTRIVKQSKAKEMPSYKTLPKYSHVPLACINPSPKKIRHAPISSDPNMELHSIPLKLK